jgi:electron transfer flavoprotein beta subunit
MNVIVVLRALRDPDSFTVNRRAQKIFVNREAYRLNPSDHNALEAALALADGAAGAVTVTAVSYGGQTAADVLYQARAMGAARAVWVSEPALHQADASVLTRVLQRVLEYLGGADLVLMGDGVLDADLAQVGPRLAAALDWPFVEAAHRVQLAPDDDNRLVGVLANSAAGAGGFRAVSAALPAVATIAADSNKPRYAPAARIIRVYAEAQAVESVTAADLGLDETAMTALVTRRGESFPPERTLGQRIEAPDELAAQLVAALRR